jgi:hypothetical protein
VVSDQAQSFDRLTLQDQLYQLGDGVETVTASQLRQLADQLGAAEQAGTAVPGPAAGRKQATGTGAQQQATTTTPPTLAQLAGQLPELQQSYRQAMTGGETEANFTGRREARAQLADFAAAVRVSVMLAGSGR